jgi:hypothetical protein
VAADHGKPLALIQAGVRIAQLAVIAARYVARVSSPASTAVRFTFRRGLAPVTISGNDLTRLVEAAERLPQVDVSEVLEDSSGVIACDRVIARAGDELIVCVHGIEGPLDGHPAVERPAQARVREVLSAGD